jgi:hypothetical protein
MEKPISSLGRRFGNAMGVFGSLEQDRVSPSETRYLDFGTIGGRKANINVSA